MTLQTRAALLRLQIEVAKAKSRGGGGQPRHPAGSSLGGQWMGSGGIAAKGGGFLSNLFSSVGFTGFGAKTLADPDWGMAQPQVPVHSIQRSGSVRHPHNDDTGGPVFIHRPKASTPPGQWGGADTVVTVTPGAKTPASLNGVALKPWKPGPDWTAVPGQNPAVEAGLPDLAGHKFKHAAAGVIIQEPDGRIWLTSPTNGFGGYRNTFPKGTQEPGLTLQQTAIKEAYEETGLRIEITGVLGDFERTTSVARYYTARRVGGDPSDQGWESQALRLAPPKTLGQFLNMPVDRDIHRLLIDEADITKQRPDGFIGADQLDRLDRLLKAASGAAAGAKGGKPGHWQTQPRWPAGTPLGGQWKTYDGEGLPMPPQIGSATNQSHAMKAGAAYQQVKAGNPAGAKAILDTLQPKIDGLGFSNGHYAKAPNSQAKWAQQTHQYIADLLSIKALATQTVAKADGLSDPPNLSAYKKIASKPGGSNPGGVYTDATGTKLLVKGAKHPSDDRARNEVLAAKLMQAAGIAAPDMHLVNLGQSYGGGLGVATKMEPLGNWSAHNPVHLAKAQADFAVHVWLANYDAVGLPPGDNLAMVGGKVFNYDPGGALLYRAQGLPKPFPGGKLPHQVSEWDGMRNKSVNAPAASVYGSMTKAQLADSAKKLQAVDDKTIKALVQAYGPGNAAAKAGLVEALIARRDDILAKAGLGGKAAAGSAAPAAAPTVDAQLLDNKVLYHGTTADAAKAIFAGGFKPSVANALGIGVYLATTPTATKDYGDALVTAKVSGKFAQFADVEALYNHPSVKQAIMGQLAAEGVKTAGLSGTAYFDAAADLMGDNPGLINAALGKDFAGVMLKNNGYVVVFDPAAAKVVVTSPGAVGATVAATAAAAPAVAIPVAGSTTPAAAAPEKGAAAPTGGGDPIVHAQHTLKNDQPGHNKFWRATVISDGSVVMLKKEWGKIGTAGQVQFVPMGSVATAQAEAAKQAKAKVAKGYHYGTSAGLPVQSAALPGAAVATAEPAAVPVAPSVPAPAGFSAQMVGTDKLVVSYMGGTFTFISDEKTKAKDWLNAAASAAKWHDEGQVLTLQAGFNAYEAAVSNGAGPGMKALAGFVAALLNADAKPAAPTEASVLQAVEAKIGEFHPTAPLGMGIGMAAKAIASADQAKFDLGIQQIKAVTEPSYVGADGKAMGKGAVAALNEAAQQAGLKAEQRWVDAAAATAPVAAGAVPVVKAIDLPPSPMPSWGGVKGGLFAKSKLSSARQKARWALIGIKQFGADKASTVDIPALQAAWDSAKSIANTFKLGSKGRANSLASVGWILDAAKVAGITVEQGKLVPVAGASTTAAAPAADDPVLSQAAAMLERASGFNGTGLLDTPLGQQTVKALAALNSGDDKALATAIGTIATGGSLSGPVLAEKLTAMAEAKGGFPMATGSAAVITAAAPEPASTGSALPPVPPVPAFQPTTPTAVAYYQGITAKMADAYAKEDVAALQKLAVKPNGAKVWPTYQSGTKAGQPKGVNAELMAAHHATLVKALVDKQSADVQAKLETPPVQVPQPGTNIGNLPAMPNFSGQKVSGTNAASHNPKVDLIEKLATAGDVKGLLALNYGTNTYGKKQAKLANDALAALGSPFTVDPGQKKHSHHALTAGVTSAAAAKSGALSDKELPPKLDFLNWNGTGKGLSSKQPFNLANQAAHDQLIALAKAGDINGLKNATFQPINEAGQPVGSPKPMTAYPSNHIQNLHASLLQQIDEKLNPPKPLEIFEAKQAAASVAALSAQIPPKPWGTHAKDVPSSQTIGYFLALGQVKGHEKLVPAKTFPVSPMHKAQAPSDYAKMSQTAKSFISQIQGSGGHPWHEANWKKAAGSGHYGNTQAKLTEQAKAAHKYARKLPAGTAVYKWDNLTPDALHKLSTAQPGLVIQNPAPVCTSYNPNSTKHFGPKHRFVIIAADGAKMISSFGSGSYSKEGELTMLPNARMMILSHTKAGANGNDFAETRVLLLPPDPTLDGNGWLD